MFHLSTEDTGFVQLTLQILPQAEATAKPAGLGREQPNNDPELMIPRAGRKWEDFIKVDIDYKVSKGWLFTLRVIFCILLFTLIFVFTLVNPGLFWQGRL